MTNPKKIEAKLKVAQVAQAAQASNVNDKILNLFEYEKEENFLTMIRPYVGKSSKGYKSPNTQKINQMNDFFNALHNNDVDNILKCANDLKIRGRRFKTHPDVLFFSGPRDYFGITFFWRLGAVKVPGDPTTYGNPVDPLIFEAPHEGVDQTSKAATLLFDQTKAKILFLNAVHPHSGPKGVKCQNKRSSADGAHNTATMFHKVHIKMSVLFPYSYFFQIHGTKAKKPLLLLVNSFNSNFKPGKSGNRILAESITEFFPENDRKRFRICSNMPKKYGFGRPTGCHNSNVQAHQLNGGGQCSVGNKLAGNFGHGEFGVDSRKKNAGHNIEKLALAFNLTMKRWVEWGEEPVDDQEPSDDQELIEHVSDIDSQEDPGDVFDDPDTDFPEFEPLNPEAIADTDTVIDLLPEDEPMIEPVIEPVPAPDPKLDPMNPDYGDGTLENDESISEQDCGDDCDEDFEQPSLDPIQSCRSCFGFIKSR
jgi:hypothetical protein